MPNFALEPDKIKAGHSQRGTNDSISRCVGRVKVIVKMLNARDIMHQCCLVPTLLLSLAVPTLATAQTAPLRAYSATELALITNLSFQSAAKEALLKRLFDARLNRLDTELK